MGRDLLHAFFYIATGNIHLLAASKGLQWHNRYSYLLLISENMPWYHYRRKGEEESEQFLAVM